MEVSTAETDERTFQSRIDEVWEEFESRAIDTDTRVKKLMSLSEEFAPMISEERRKQIMKDRAGTRSRT